MTFTPDPHLFVKTHHQLKYLDTLDLIILKRAAERYFEASPEGRPDLYVRKAIECDLMDKQKGYLWRIFQSFYFDGRLFQLLWIPEDLGL